MSREFSRPGALGSAGLVLSLAAPMVVIPAYGQPRQLNTELHGNGIGSVRQAGLASLGNTPWNMGGLTSEYRHDVFLSGRLRSEIRGEYLARGPLAPGGFRAYIPASPTPLGTPRPYSGGPPTIVGTPSPVNRSAPFPQTMTGLPKPYTGVLRGLPTSSTGTLRPPWRAAATAITGAPVAPPGVKPPLLSNNYGVLRGQ